jgi:hypothetical protein
MTGFTANQVLQTRADRFRGWLDAPQRVSHRWLGKYCVLVAWLGLVLAAVSPPHGSGISLCFFQDATGVPCPGCGMTRSLSCGLRGMWLDSFQYHPMGLLILGLFVFTAGQSLLPRTQREGIVRFMQSRATFFNVLYLAFVVTFVGFGAVRALHHLVVTRL